MSAAPAARRLRSAGRPRRPVLRAVPSPARHPLLWTLLGVLVLAAAVFGAVTSTALAADASIEADQLERRLVDAEATYTELVAEVAVLESPARIAASAAALGLVRVERPRQLVVDRVLPADGAGRDARVDAGDTTDHLKPLLAGGDG